MTTIADDSFYATTLGGPANDAAVVAPDDANDLSHVSRALWIGTGGDLKVTMKGGQILVFPSLGVGWHPLRVSRIWATGTTADKIATVW